MQVKKDRKGGNCKREIYERKKNEKEMKWCHSGLRHSCCVAEVFETRSGFEFLLQVRQVSITNPTQHQVFSF